MMEELDPEETEPLLPQEGPQTDFFTVQADILIYGGSAGGGKSYALLMEGARYRDVEGMRGLLLRRTTKQFLNPGGLWDESHNIYPDLLGTSNSTNYTWHWPSGAWLKLGHLQHEKNKEDHQGAQYGYLGLDELTHFSNGQFWYMQSRLRSVSGIKPYTRCTTNPAPGWVRDFLAPWINKDWDGPGGPAKSGEVRWFFRKSDDIVWLTTEEKEKRDRLGLKSTSVAFVRSSVYDNKKLLLADPDYLTKLESLPEHDRRKLLEGDWDVFDGQFFTEWSPKVHVEAPLPVGALPSWWKFYAGLDWGYGSPFAFVLRAFDPRTKITRMIESVKVAGLTEEQQATRVLDILSRWRLQPGQVLISFDKNMGYPQNHSGIIGDAQIAAYYRVGLTNAAPSVSSRPSGWSSCRKRLHCPIVGPDGKSLRFRVWDKHNAQFIHDIPRWRFADESEDLDTHQDDHLADAWRYSEDATPPEGLLVGQETKLGVANPQAHLPHALQTDDSRDDLELE